MNAEAIISVSAAVLACTQLLKWNGLPDKHGPLAVLFLSALGVALYVFSTGMFARVELFGYFAGWITVSTSASGIYGFTRASAEALVKALPPPNSGAGSEPTIKT